MEPAHFKIKASIKLGFFVGPMSDHSVGELQFGAPTSKLPVFSEVGCTYRVFGNFYYKLLGLVEGTE